MKTVEEPKIKIARWVAKKFDKPIVIIFDLDEKKLMFTVYGKDISHEDFARRLAQVAYEAIMQELSVE